MTFHLYAYYRGDQRWDVSSAPEALRTIRTIGDLINVFAVCADNIGAVEVMLTLQRQGDTLSVRGTGRDGANRCLDYVHKQHEPADGEFIELSNRLHSLQIKSSHFADKPRPDSRLGGQKALINELSAALTALMSVQNGPPLVRLTADWNRAMNDAARAIKNASGEQNAG